MDDNYTILSCLLSASDTMIVFP